MPSKIDLTGHKYGMLTVIEQAENKKDRTAWLCQCECGNKKIVPGLSLRCLSTKSCGCILHKGTHKLTKTKEYRAWAHMLSRCRNKKDDCYKHYGGRGISVCERWLSFENFYLDMGKRPSKKHSIDRIDNNGNYCKENCRWVIRYFQDRNRRTNVYFEYDGKRMIVVDWARHFNISVDGLRSYLKTHTFEQAYKRYTDPNYFFPISNRCKANIKTSL